MPKRKTKVAKPRTWVRWAFINWLYYPHEVKLAHPSMARKDLQAWNGRSHEVFRVRITEVLRRSK